ncbi:diphosphomevalonate decarboxylase [Bombilactobacillus thymidiniphilus]|uniref:diphosphomevalonate decarboxylase n=1 Tax=Bombilactobacillus thymidiniphilus TaxID=2923363 RepID=A0ABY4PD14_9LACO|nr:diphosphomevalonate decarboxylase [Bombilactobacillus thymidiniphilus]UQS83558.1 diphosphomevalonate decarboxylase [Bombilactobacillus thymidiniphilus]
MTNTTTTAHTNIALIKYWGKKDAQLRLPYTDSLSLTLDGYYTTTTTAFSDATHDQIYLNKQLASTKFAQRTKNYLDLVRQKYQVEQHFIVQTDNFVPTAAGLASSASGFAALAGSLNKLLNLDLDNTQLSRLARLGSGSAARSIFGGFVRWYHGNDDETSYAAPINNANDIPIRLLSVVFDTNTKKTTSTTGMEHAVQTSPYFVTWPQIVQQDLQQMLHALDQKDLKLVGQIAENNALAMHALNWTARPAFSYFSADTTDLLAFIRRLRQQGLLAYATIDAGPNVKIISSTDDISVVQQQISQHYPSAQTTILKPGTAIH